MAVLATNRQAADMVISAQDQLEGMAPRLVEGSDEEAGQRDGGSARRGDEHRGDVMMQAARGEVAHGGKDQRHQRQVDGGAEARRPA